MLNMVTVALLDMVTVGNQEGLPHGNSVEHAVVNNYTARTLYSLVSSRLLRRKGGESPLGMTCN